MGSHSRRENRVLSDRLCRSCKRYDNNTRYIAAQARVIITYRLRQGMHPDYIEQCISEEMLMNARGLGIGYSPKLLEWCLLILDNLRNAGQFAGLPSMVEYESFQTVTVEMGSFRTQMQGRFANEDIIDQYGLNSGMRHQISREQPFDRGVEDELRAMREDLHQEAEEKYLAIRNGSRDRGSSYDQGPPPRYSGSGYSQDSRRAPSASGRNDRILDYAPNDMRDAPSFVLRGRSRDTRGPQSLGPRDRSRDVGPPLSATTYIDYNQRAPPLRRTGTRYPPNAYNNGSRRPTDSTKAQQGSSISRYDALSLAPPRRSSSRHRPDTYNNSSRRQIKTRGRSCDMRPPASATSYTEYQPQAPLTQRPFSHYPPNTHSNNSRHLTDSMQTHQGSSSSHYEPQPSPRTSSRELARREPSRSRFVDFASSVMNHARSRAPSFAGGRNSSRAGSRAPSTIRPSDSISNRGDRFDMQLLARALPTQRQPVSSSHRADVGTGERHEDYNEGGGGTSSSRDDCRSGSRHHRSGSSYRDGDRERGRGSARGWEGRY